MPEPLDVTLYIPCYNAERFLDETVPAVRSQTHPIAEILVIDDGCRDGTAEAARRHGLRVVSHAGNLGLGAARNTGVKEARTTWVASLDADVRPRADWLERLAEAVEGGRFAGACGQLREARLLSLPDQWRATHMRQSWGEERIVNPSFLFGHSTLLFREALLKVGGYDRRCLTNWEDVDVSGRLRAAGYDLVYEPSAIGDHLREDSFDSIARTYWNYYYNPVDHLGDDARAIRKVRRESRKVARRLLKGDLRARRWSLLIVDAYIGLKWRRYARRLGGSRHVGSRRASGF